MLLCHLTIFKTIIHNVNTSKGFLNFLIKFNFNFCKVKGTHNFENIYSIAS